MKKKIFKSKVASVLVIALVFALCFSGVVSAAAGFTVYPPTYDTYVNGQLIAKDNVVVHNGKTMINVSNLESFGVLKNWNESQRIANFFIPNQLPNTGNTNSISDLAKSELRFYKNQMSANNFCGNGIFVNEDLVIVPAQVWTPSIILKAYDYKNTLVNFETQKIAETNRLVLLKTKGYKSDYYATLADTRVEAGDDVVLVGSIAQQPNFYNFSTVKDYFDFNPYTTGDKEYLRTYNNCQQDCIGSGIYNDKGELTGIFYVKGANYAISITLGDIESFVPSAMLP